jgi:hypothetical protein
MFKGKTTPLRFVHVSHPEINRIF